MTDIMARVKKHYDRAVEHYGAENVLGVFLYGSWNYGTALPDSDVDTKCILIPDLYHLAIQRYEVKHLHIDEEVCECMTIMHMADNWKKQNINFLEIMFTDYCMINPMYKEAWDKMLPLEEREAIARFNPEVAILSMGYQALHTLKQDPNDLKKIMNASRIHRSIAQLIAYPKLGYKAVIYTPQERGIRTGEIEIREDYVEDLIDYFNEVISIAPSFRSTEDHRRKVQSFLEDLILGLISFRINKI